MRIRRVDIENFRGIRSASWRLPPDGRFFALIGPGDSTKTTVLTAVERALHDRAGQSVLDTDFHGVDVEHPICIRVAVDSLPDELLAMDAFGGFLSGIGDDGEWTHDPADNAQPCVIVEYLVQSDLEPLWQSYRPPLDGVEQEQPQPIRARHRARMTAYRIDDRIDTHLRWSRTSSLGRLTASKDDTRSTLTLANRAARDAASGGVTDALKHLAKDVQTQVEAIGTTKFSDMRPGLDMSLTSNQGNLALFDGDIPLSNFGLGTRRLTGAATQQLANQSSATLLVDEVEHGLEPHRLVHLLSHLRSSKAFSQVIVTTHSPTALQHLEPDELVLVRSTAGATELASLNEPAELRRLLKRSPEAFLARRIVIGEGKTEYGVVLEHLDEWNLGTNPEPTPSAALGVVAIEGNGGTGSAGWAEQLLKVGYEVVLFIDGDDMETNKLAAGVAAAGGVVVQWSAAHSIETAICAQLDENGLTAFIEAAVDAAEDADSARHAYAGALHAKGVPEPAHGSDTLDVTTWADYGLPLDDARAIVGATAKSRGWFKRVDRGRRLGRFMLDSPQMKGGDVQATVDALKAAVFAPAHPTSAAPSPASPPGPGNPGDSPDHDK